MKYRIVRNHIGTIKKDIICEFDIPCNINDICFIPKFGFLLVLRDNHCVSHVDLNGKIELSWLGHMDEEGYKNCTGQFSRLSYPSSISYDSIRNHCFLVERGGASIRLVELNPPYITNLMSNQSIMGFESKELMDSVEGINTSCVCGSYLELYFVIDRLNACYKYSKGIIKKIAGSGERGYSIGSDLKSCMFNNPRGIEFIGESKNIYILDSGNKCIRMINGNKISLIKGSPISDEFIKNPLCLKHNKGILYYIDDNCVKYYSSSESGNSVLYNGNENNIRFIEVDNKDLIVMENINE